MTAPVPATIASELNEEINAMAWTKNFNELAVRRIKTKAQILKSRNPFDYHSILGRCDCLLGDLDDMRSHFKAAINIAPSNPAAYLDYGISVSMWGFHNEAWEYVSTAFSIAGGDPGVVRRVLREAWQSCRFITVKKLLERLAVLGVEMTTDELNPYHELARACTLFESLDLTDEQGAQAAEAYGTFLREHKIFNPGETVNYLCHPDGRAHVVFSCDVGRSDVENLNWELFAYFADMEIEIEQRGYLVFKFVPKKDDEDKLVA